MVYNILLVNGFLHHKNMNAIQKYSNIHFTTVNSIEECNDLSLYDGVFSPSTIIDVSKYPNTKFIFGPHFSVIPNDFINTINGPNTIYIQPSQWVIDFWKLYPICDQFNIQCLPFGVDTERFLPSSCGIDNNEKSKVFIYFKGRKPQELQFLVDYLNTNNIEFRIFNYRQRYNEQEYIDYLQSCKYGIWLDAHESQGFALEEALSCNVPLLVWNVSTLNQEDGYTYPDYKATSIPYWDASCGEVFYNDHEFESTFQLFLSKLDVYHPRKYILENLSIDVCEKQFIELLK
jgi:glycosyltransferase involved in cell wall biosynthesis